MSILKATPVDIEWHPGLTIFASEKFLRTVGDEWGWLAGVDELGVRRCILPYTIVKKAGVRMVRFRVETIPQGKELAIDEERTFLNSVVDHFHSSRADIIIPATTNTIFRTCPERAAAAPYGTYIIDLEEDEVALFGKISSSHRRKIRLSEKGDVQIESSPQFVEQVYKLIRDTFKRSSIPFMSFASFKKQVDGLGENVKLFIATRKGDLQGGMMIPFSTHSAYYVYGGSVPEPAPGAMNLMHWEAIKMFREFGVKRYDFCGVRLDPAKGSKQEGLKAFKARFGPRLIQGYMWKCPLNSVKSTVYSLAVRVLRGGDIVDAELRRLKSTRAR